jgi:L-ascorbate metabolism protein UlaG (beta-lactamase superfamily)
MTPSVTYYGNAVCSIELGSDSVLVDPYVSGNDEHDLTVAEVVEAADPDAVLVTHAAHDHMGDAETIALEYDVPVLTEPAVGHVLEANGVPAELVTTVVWGMTATVGDLSIRILEAHHVSITEHEGDLVSGHPLSFLVSDGDHGVYHMGDTSIFSDLQLVGERHDPDVICMGVGQAYDAAAEMDERITKNIAELSTDEAVTVAEWIDPEYVVPIHYVGDEREQFVDALDASSADAEAAPLDVGETLEL